MLAEDHIRFREPFEQPVVDHGLRAFRRLLARLKDRHDGPAPRRPGLGEQFGGAGEPGHVHVVAAHVPDGDGVSVAILRGDLAGIGKPGRFLDGQRVHVGAQHHGRSLAVPEQADHAGLPDACRDFVAGRTKTVCRQSRRARLLHRQLGVRMHILVEFGQIGQQGVNVA
jgi:hypothetical protein